MSSHLLGSFTDLINRTYFCIFVDECLHNDRVLIHMQRYAFEMAYVQWKLSDIKQETNAC